MLQHWVRSGLAHLAPAIPLLAPCRHDLAAAARDRCAASVARLKAQLGLPATTSAEGSSSGASSVIREPAAAEPGSKSSGQAEAAAGGKSGGQAAAGSKGSKGGGGLRHRLAVRSLRSAEAGLTKWAAKADELELQVAAAREEALAKPLGTAFIALFK